MGAGKEGHHPYPFPFDASEVVGREPGSVATHFYIVHLVFQCILIYFSFLTPLSIYSYQLNDLYS